MTHYQYQVGGSLPQNAPTYVRRQANHNLYQGLKAGDFCYVLNSRQMGKLRIYNRIYAEVFKQEWCDKILVNLRPYSEKCDRTSKLELPSSEHQ
ncbi:hypothetical protein LC609_17745 [Nostoc sp. XA013]|nr:hypothetical protein [Nostoc sp. XA013]